MTIKDDGRNKKKLAQDCEKAGGHHVLPSKWEFMWIGIGGIGVYRLVCSRCGKFLKISW